MVSSSGTELRSLKPLIPTVYLPAILFGIGQGAILPVIALTARELGASVGLASLVVALLGIGQLFGDLPAGSFAARIGERRAMVGSVALITVALLLCVVATQVWMLAAAIGIVGIASAVWGIARHTYLTEVVPYQLRARAMSTLGGSHRIGAFAGPFLGAAAMQFWGTNGSYIVHIATAGVAALLVGFIKEPIKPKRPDKADGSLRDTVKVLRNHLPVFATLGSGALMVGIVRASRAAVIPLWAESIGVDGTTTSIIFGLSGAVDMLLFYPAGKAMDKFGRAFVAVPCMTVMGLSLLLLPFTHSAFTLLLVALLLGFGNGLGSGIILTLGSDVSPATGRAQFLGGWRLCADTGTALGPVIVSGVTVAIALGPAIWAIAAIGFGGAAALKHWIPRTQPAMAER